MISPAETLAGWKKILLIYPPTDRFQCQNLPRKIHLGRLTFWKLQIYHLFFRKENDHREFQVPKNGGTEPYKAVLGVGFPLHQPLHTAFIGEDSSILGTWNVWWWSSNPTSAVAPHRCQLLHCLDFKTRSSWKLLQAPFCGHGPWWHRRGETSSSSVDAEGSWGWKRFGMTGNDRFIKYKIKLQEISA